MRWSGIIHHENQDMYLEHVASSKIYDVAVMAFNYNSSPKIIQTVEDAAGKGVGVIAMKTQSPNYLSGVMGDAPDHAKALEWVLSKRGITAAIPGMTTKAQVEMNLQVMNKTLKIS